MSFDLRSTHSTNIQHTQKNSGLSAKQHQNQPLILQGRLDLKENLATPPERKHSLALHFSELAVGKGSAALLAVKGAQIHCLE